jgi:hypothetical protein
MRSSRQSSPAVAAPSNLPPADHKSVMTVASQIRLHGTGGVPMLKLMGDWLAFVGFPTGTFAVLTAESGRIVIEAQGHLSEPGALDKRRRLRASLGGS